MTLLAAGLLAAFLYLLVGAVVAGLFARWRRGKCGENEVILLALFWPVPFAFYLAFVPLFYLLVFPPFVVLVKVFLLARGNVPQKEVFGED